ncbi:MAG: phosphonate metabolism protein/1,5-bisphosphokinase (PRPP-forming) PhnN [Marivita sp.]|uniref:phosphonate metabolism protein/1,5-bisphosphokinase (PRPP-forming) PhnN n=1 Tax=Marivita sp. TaxID=2003365 RepID=UPI003EF32FC6
MTGGRLIAVVGPSGVGKDSVMDGMIAARPDMRLVRRTITRAPGLGGEDYTAVTQDAFDAAAQKRAFCVYWSAHGLSYGIPADVLTDVKGGKDCLANFSRSALIQARSLFPDLIVLNITASPATLAHRLAGRGRETEAEIAARLAQADKALPSGLNVVTVTNDGALEDTVTQALAALQPVRA